MHTTIGATTAVSEERAARNDAMYRILKAEGVVTADWICECADPACAMLVTMSLDGYETIRADAGLRIVHPHALRSPKAR